MGATAAAVAAALAVTATAAVARADDDCTGRTDSGGRFAICFDPGNRLVVDASTAGYGGGARLRHVLTFDDEPGLRWKLAHEAVTGRAGGLANRYELVAYAGRYLRHARDGHVVLPFSVDRKLFLPFDVGADAEVGRLSGELGAPAARLGVVRASALIDWSRSASFRRRLAVGAVVRWDMQLEREPMAIAAHVVSPLTTAVLDAHLETRSGMTAADLRVEAGRAWSSTDGWHTALSADASIERVIVAINDRPVSLVLAGRYRRATEELTAEIGVRFALFQRLDPRVNLRPLDPP